MHERLKWNAIGLQQKTELLLKRVNEEKGNTPSSHSNKHEKLQGFKDELDHLLDTMRKIQNELIPDLEKIYRIEFKTPELVTIALSRPSVKIIFKNLEVFLNPLPKNPLTQEEYEELGFSGKAAEVLALIGDSVLDYRR